MGVSIRKEKGSPIESYWAFSIILTQSLGVCKSLTSIQEGISFLTAVSVTIAVPCTIPVKTAVAGLPDDAKEQLQKPFVESKLYKHNYFLIDHNTVPQAFFPKNWPMSISNNNLTERKRCTSFDTHKVYSKQWDIAFFIPSNTNITNSYGRSWTCNTTVRSSDVRIRRHNTYCFYSKRLLHLQHKMVFSLSHI